MARVVNKTKLWRYPTTVHQRGDTICTIGTFDGLHLGHQALIARLVEIAAKEKLSPTVLAFYPHPKEVVSNIRPIPPVMMLREQLEELSRLGVESLYRIRFCEKMMSMTAEDFMQDILSERLSCKFLLVGPDLAIGKNREGSTDVMSQLAKQRGWGFEVMKPVVAEGASKKIGTRQIRELLIEGEMEEANALLGRPYRLSGRVVKGDQRGRTIGVPTANVHVAKSVPLSFGVYVAEAKVSDQIYPAVVNVGKRPTFHKEDLSVEAHFLTEEDVDCYGERCTISFLHYVRSEQKFSGIENLKKQIDRDIIEAKRYLEEL